MLSAFQLAFGKTAVRLCPRGSGIAGLCADLRFVSIPAGRGVGDLELHARWEFPYRETGGDGASPAGSHREEHEGHEAKERGGSAGASPYLGRRGFTADRPP